MLAARSSAPLRLSKWHIDILRIRGVARQLSGIAHILLEVGFILKVATALASGGLAWLKLPANKLSV